jgi:hypothetical protein
VRPFSGIVRDLALLANSIGYGFEQFRRLNGESTATLTTEQSADGSGVAQDSARQLGDDFLLSIAVGFNQGVLSNIDAIDSALIGVLGATGAFAVLTVDKLRELAAVPRWIAIALLASSALVSLAGYAYGFIGRSTRDGPRPALFVPDFSLYGLKAVARAIRETVRRSEENLHIRRRKRIVALAAIALLIAGAVVVTYARLLGPALRMS